jgi:hypothetical protein
MVYISRGLKQTQYNISYFGGVFMKKRILAFLSTSIFLFVFFIPTQTVEAAYVPISPYYLYAATVKSTLVIQNGTATCSSELVGGTSVTKIIGYQYLQKKNSNDTWSTVSGGSWSKTENDTDLVMINTKSSLSPGTYQLKTVFYVYSGSNYETIEKVSNTVTV